MATYDRMFLQHTLIRHEGSVKTPDGHHKLYKCSEGIQTLGYGRNVQENGITDATALQMLDEDIANAERDMDYLYSAWRELTPTRQMVLLNMAFNMGRKRLSGFKKMWAAIAAGDFTRAAVEMLDSKWALQVGPRAAELAEWMEKG